MCVGRGGSVIIAASSLTCLAEVMATRNVTCIERWEREHVANGSKGGFVRAQQMRLKSHGSMGFSTGGKAFSKSFMKQTVVVECVNTNMPCRGEEKGTARCPRIELRARLDVFRART